MDIDMEVLAAATKALDAWDRFTDDEIVTLDDCRIATMAYHAIGEYDISFTNRNVFFARRKFERTFKFFPFLSKEIRLLIWEAALPGPRIVQLYVKGVTQPFGTDDWSISMQRIANLPHQFEYADVPAAAEEMYGRDIYAVKNGTRAVIIYPSQAGIGLHPTDADSPLVIEYANEENSNEEEIDGQDGNEEDAKERQEEPKVQIFGTQKLTSWAHINAMNTFKQLVAESLAQLADIKGLRKLRPARSPLITTRVAWLDARRREINKHIRVSSGDDHSPLFSISQESRTLVLQRWSLIIDADSPLPILFSPDIDILYLPAVCKRCGTDSLTRSISHYAAYTREREDFNLVIPSVRSIYLIKYDGESQGHEILQQHSAQRVI